MAKKIAANVLDSATLARLAAEYSELKTRASQIDKRKKEIADILKNYAQKFGAKDDCGSYYVDVKGYTFGSQCRKSIRFNDSAVGFLRSKGLDQCIEMTPHIIEDEVTSAYNNGDISIKELEEITEQSVSYAITVTAHEEMPEVQQTQVAASRKTSLLKSPRKE